MRQFCPASKIKNGRLRFVIRKLAPHPYKWLFFHHYTMLWADFKPGRRDAQSPSQGNFRQAITVAQKCASVCGDTTRQQLKELADDPARWSTCLVKQLIGPQRTTLQAALAQYSAPEVDQLQWEAAAAGLGLRQVHIPYAAEAGVSPGAQLFVLAQT
jgi:hypothetical protein